MKVNILGAEWTIKKLKRENDNSLTECDGYCDKTTREIVVIEKPSDSDLNDFEEYQKKCLRHEIIHAFLFESGLGENFAHPEWGHDEIMIDWIAYQSPKIFEVFKEVGCM